MEFRAQRASLIERKEDLQKRQTQLSLNRIKHFTLQKEIHESLTKSRERLGRLESLEKEEEELPMYQSRNMSLEHD